jgi:hypothetical protein
MKQLQVVNSSLERNPVLDKPGRLNYDYSQNKIAVEDKIVDSIFKAAVVLGISTNGPNIGITAKEVITKILATYPAAFVDDICLSISMASYGEIKLENQLTVLSAANIFCWYKEFRLNHSEKSTMPYLPIREIQEVSESQKHSIMLNAFCDFINDPEKHETGIAVYYPKLENIGAYKPSNEEKLQVLYKNLKKFIEGMPMEVLRDHAKRKQAYQFKDYLDALSDYSAMSIPEWRDNPIFKKAVEASKKEMLISFIKSTDKNQLIEIYKNSLHDKK